MKAIKFKQHNVVFAENQEEDLPLLALRLETKEGEVIFCQRLSLSERVRVVFLGNIWVSLMMFGQPMTPSFLSTKRKDVFSIPWDKVSFTDKFRLFIDVGLIIYLDVIP